MAKKPVVPLEKLPSLESVVKHGLGSRASAERDLARIKSRGGEATRVKGTKFRPLED